MFKHVKFNSTSTSIQKKDKQRNTISNTLTKRANIRGGVIQSLNCFNNTELESSQKLTSKFNLTRTIQSIPKSTENRLFQNKNSTLYNRTNSNNNKSTNNTKYSPYLTDNVEYNKYNKQIMNSDNFNNNKPLLFANLNNVRISHKPFGIIHSYATMTSNGKRDYNEDRVCILYNIPKPNDYKENNWPNCSFFGLYDGHGGHGACDFLRDNLHKFIIYNKYFPTNPQRAIANGFIQAEKTFLKNYGESNDTSGSCAIIILIIENRVYIANVGDSRAILSAKNGTKFYMLSKDHRPGDEGEYKRILDAGGKIYKTEYEYEKIQNKNMSIVGPLRVLPGKLSVSRTIGDIEAKDPRYGGNPNVIISTPEIKYFDNNNKNDFILIGCDGIYEKLKNKEIIDKIWQDINNNNFADVHNLSGYCIENIINECLKKECNDNLTLIMLSLKDYSGLKNINNVAKTENNNKSKKVLLPAEKSKRPPLKQPLSVLLTKLIHNNSTNVKKVVNLKDAEKKKKIKNDK